ncbi:small GTP-binding protein [Bradyrhizobium sp. LM6.10]
MGQDVRSPRGPRCIALVGPFQSGKTTLLEAILARTGAIPRAGSVDAGTSVGDASAEARHHKMTVGLTAATTNFMGDSYTFLDCPGSVEFAHDMRAALPAVDAAIVVCEADEKKLPQLQIILRELEELNIPRFLFLNKIDRANKRIRETLEILQPASRVPLVLRQIPIWNNELIEGFVDLALERAFVYREHKASEVVALEGGDLDREKEARFSMLEKLADHDDALMEQLLEDIQPPRDAVFDDLARELREGQICPVLIGAAARENGVLRLMKALRHEAPGVAETAKRLGVPETRDALGFVFKTLHSQHGGKLSLTRLLAGHLDDGATLQSSSGGASRISGILAVTGAYDTKRGAAEAGDTVALAKLDPISTGDTVSNGKDPAGCARSQRADAAGARDLGCGHRPQGRRQARPGADAAARGGSFARLRDERPDPRHRAVGTGRDAPARRERAAARPLWRQSCLASPRDRLSGDHPQADRPARPPQEAVRRPRPVRRCRARHQAAAARRRLQVRREGGRRRGAAQLHRRGGRGRRRRAHTRSARFPRTPICR